ncbi:MAG: FkbM family methyltransferase [Magnetococcales bacterium]|nr:FkbM family methyltransferase [Magnetococcales bacterium]
MSGEQSVLEVRIKGSVTVAVPHDLTLATPYILLEQEDWFEPEIAFVRGLVRPGMHLLDIGANYGVYALTMAQLAGSDGAVCAVEPTPQTADYLQKSILLNGLNNIRLMRVALSNREGEVEIFCSPHSELNSLQARPGLVPQKVPLMTLDGCLAACGWDRVDFIKLDAEGEELRVLEGGGETLTSSQPLIQMEVRHGGQLHLVPVFRLVEQGYRVYRLIPGLNILAPCDPSPEMENPPLNLFLCTDERARRLELEGHLVSHHSKAAPLATCRLHNQWPKALLTRPFSQPLRSDWVEPKTQDGIRYALALHHYMAAQEDQQPPVQRLAWLREALAGFRQTAAQRPSFSRLSSLARCAIALGEARLARETLPKIQAILGTEQGQGALDEPLLPVSQRFEEISPQDDPMAWRLVGLLETMQKINAHSSYYSGTHDEALLGALVQYPYHGAEVERRLQLIRMRCGRQMGPSKDTGMNGTETLNPHFWDVVAGKMDAMGKVETVRT